MFMAYMHTAHDLVLEAETILSHKETDTAQGIRCLQLTEGPEEQKPRGCHRACKVTPLEKPPKGRKLLLPPQMPPKVEVWNLADVNRSVGTRLLINTGTEI